MPRSAIQYGSPNWLLQAFILSTVAAAQANVPLAFDRSVDGELTAPTEKVFSTTLKAGELLRITVEDHGINIRLELRRADGTVATSSKRKPGWKETILFQSPKAGRYEVALVTPMLNLTGRYRLEASRRNVATQQDLLEIEAERASAIAYETSQKSSSAEAKETLTQAEEARALWDRVGNADESAYAQLMGAAANRFGGQYAKSLSAATESITSFRKAKDLAGEAAADRIAGRAELMMGNPEAALHYYRQSVALTQQVNDVESLSRRYTDLGTAYTALSQEGEADAALERGLGLSRQLGHLENEGAALHNLADLASRESRFTDAVRYGQEAVGIFHKLGEQYFEAVALLTLGQAWRNLGEMDKCLGAYEQVLDIRRKLADQQGIAFTLEFLAEANKQLGRYDEAIAELEEAQAIRAKTDFKFGSGANLSDLADLYSFKRQYDKALTLYQKSLEISRKQNERRAEADTLSSLSGMFLELGDEDRAIDYAERSLSLYHAIRAPLASYPIATLGDAYLRKGDLKHAEAYLRRSVQVASEDKTKPEESLALTELSAVFEMDGRPKEALAALQQALTTARQMQNPDLEGQALIQLGAVKQDLGQPQQAREFLEQALDLYRSLKSEPDRSLALTQLARVEQAEGNLPRAQALLEQSIAISEQLSAQLYNPASRLAWFSSVQRTSKLYVDVLMARNEAEPGKGFNTLAFDAMERSRARSLLDALRTSKGGVLDNADPKLSEREQRLGEQINALEAGRFKLVLQKQAEQTSELDSKIEELQSQLEQVQGELRRSDPRYGILTQPSSIRLKDIQAELDDSTCLIEYSLGEKRSFVWLIRQRSFSSYELASQRKIKQAVALVHEVVTVRSRERTGTVAERQSRAAKADQQFPAAVRVLSDLVLGPLHAELHHERLVIVSDGALGYVPFDLLSDERDYRPLVLNHELTMLPSASTIVIERRLLARRPPAPKLLAMFADPVFSYKDERARKESVGDRRASVAAAGNESRILEHLSDGSVEQGATSELAIPRLRYTADEAKRIEALAPDSEELSALGFEANRRRATEPGLSQYQFVHFATHGWVDSEHPERSSLVLSLIDKDGREQDGLLRASDIYRLNLPAQVITLSACQTGLGKLVEGEGLGGLTQAFLYAGAARVVVSSWNVNDEETAALMVAFYTGMLKEKLSPAAALRSAQLEIRKQERWRAPYYWAPFAIYGEWR